MHIQHILLATAAAAALTAAGCADAGPLASPDGAQPSLYVASVNVVCPDTISVGQSAQCIHYAYDQNNSLVSGTAATWSTTTPSLVSVSSSGQVAGLAVGNATVRATVDAVVGQRNVYVKPGLSLTIHGPSPIRRNQTCIWSVLVTGGTAPYSYFWSATGGVGTAWLDSWEGYTPGSGGFTLHVTVTDANGVQATVSRFIYVNPSAPAYC